MLEAFLFFTSLFFLSSCDEFDGLTGKKYTELAKMDVLNSLPRTYLEYLQC